MVFCCCGVVARYVFEARLASSERSCVVSAFNATRLIREGRLFGPSGALGLSLIGVIERFLFAGGRAEQR